MWQMRQSGASLQSIGDAFGISRQRVGWLLQEHRSTAIIGLLSRSQVAELAGCRVSYISKLRRRGIIQPVAVPGRKWALWGADSLGKVISHQRCHPEVCQICGQPLPSRRPVYCSAECKSKGGYRRQKMSKGDK